MTERSKFLCISYLNKIYSNTDLLTHKIIFNFEKKLTAGRLNYKNSDKIFIHCIENTIHNENILFTNRHYNMYMYNYDIILQKNTINIELGKFLQHNKNPNTLIENLIKSENSMAIFTDRSKSVNSVSVGCASVSLNPRNVTSKSIKNIASIFTAECIATINALDIDLNYTEQNIMILSDSLSVLS